MESLSDDHTVWVIEVEKSFNQPLESDGSHGIYGRVPKSLLSENTEIFYIPKAISFGPYHFWGKNPLEDEDEVEVLKSEIVKKYRDRWGGYLDSVVQNFKTEDTQKRIKKTYGKGFPIHIGKDVLAWMMVRDGCFLLELLEGFSKEENEESSGWGRQNSRTPSSDGILNRYRYHPLLPDIVKDMFKMENQLPLWVLKKIVPVELELNLASTRVAALRTLSPIEVNIDDDWEYNEEHHILHLLHDYIVHHRNVPNCHWNVVNKALLSVIYSASTLQFYKVWRVVAFALNMLVLSPVLIFIFAWFVIALIWELYQECIRDEAPREETHIPTIEELRKLGVKFKKLEGRGIYHIKFEQSTLYLPKFRIDDRSGVILRNLMALEIYSNDVDKPITRYAYLMNDLVNTSADVAILRKHNIITNKLGSDEDVAKFWNSFMVATEMPTCNPIDLAASSINSYCKKRWKVLWAQFKMLHCSKPWLVLSLLGGTSLLMLTVVQVACLFRNCQIREA